MLAIKVEVLQTRAANIGERRPLVVDVVIHIGVPRCVSRSFRWRLSHDERFDFGNQITGILRGLRFTTITLAKPQDEWWWTAVEWDVEKPEPIPTTSSNLLFTASRSSPERWRGADASRNDIT